MHFKTIENTDKNNLKNIWTLPIEQNINCGRESVM